MLILFKNNLNRKLSVMATYPTNKARINYSRLCRAVVDLGTDVFRHELNRQVHPADVKKKLKSCPARLRPNQWTLINNAATVGSYKELDISLPYQILRLLSQQELRNSLASHVIPKDINTKVKNCPALISDPGTKLSSSDLLEVKQSEATESYQNMKEKLLRNLCKYLCVAPLSAMHPTFLWGNDEYPDPVNHITIGDDIERIRLIRNNVYAHIPSTEILDTDFNKSWTLLNDIMARMDRQLSITNFQQDLKNIETSVMDEESDKWYNDEITRLANDERELQTEIKRINKDVVELKTDVTELKAENEIIHSEICIIKNLMHQTHTKLNSERSSATKSLKKSKKQNRKRKHYVHTSVEEKQTKRKVMKKETTRTDRARNEVKENVKDTGPRRCSPFYRKAKRCNDLTLTRIEEHRNDKTYVVTAAVIKGEEILKEHGMLVYSGLSGNGKTENALEIMKRVKDANPNWLFLKLDDARKWGKYINPNVDSLVLLDDCIGKTNTEKDILNANGLWDDIQSCVRVGKVRVILTVRKNILNQNLVKLEHCALFSNKHTVDLTSPEYKLSTEDKRHILLCHCKCSNIEICGQLEDENHESADRLEDETPIQLHELTVDRISRSDPVIGFPLSCSYFVGNRKYTKQGVKFFEKPTQKLIDEIDELMKSESSHKQKLQYCIMSYMLLKGGLIDFNHLDLEMFNRVSESCNLSSPSTERERFEAIEHYNHRYVIQVDASKYEFKHQTVLESVAICFYKDNPKLLLELCSKEFISEFIRSPNYEKSEGEIVINVTKDKFDTLIKRIIQMIQIGLYDDVKWLENHSLLDDSDFVNDVINVIRSDGDIDETSKKDIEKESLGLLTCTEYKNTNYLSGQGKATFVSTLYAKLTKKRELNNTVLTEYNPYSSDEYDSSQSDTYDEFDDYEPYHDFVGDESDGDSSNEGTSLEGSDLDYNELDSDDFGEGESDNHSPIDFQLFESNDLDDSELDTDDYDGDESDNDSHNKGKSLEGNEHDNYELDTDDFDGSASDNDSSN